MPPAPSPAPLAFLVFVSALVMLGACGAAPDAPADARASGAGPEVSPVGCTPGRVEACPCNGAPAAGSQVCQRDGTFGACVCPDGGALDAVTADAPPDAPDAPAVPDDGAPWPDVVRPRDGATDGPTDAPAGRSINDPPAPSCYGSCATHQECFAACFVQGDSPRFCCYRGRCVASESACTDVPALMPERVCGRATCERDEQCQCGAPGERWRCMSRAPFVGSCARAP